MTSYSPQVPYMYRNVLKAHSSAVYSISLSLARSSTSTGSIRVSTLRAMKMYCRVRVQARRVWLSVQMGRGVSSSYSCSYRFRVMVSGTVRVLSVSRRVETGPMGESTLMVRLLLTTFWKYSMVSWQLVQRLLRAATSQAQFWPRSKATRKLPLPSRTPTFTPSTTSILFCPCSFLTDRATISSPATSLHSDPPASGLHSQPCSTPHQALHPSPLSTFPSSQPSAYLMPSPHIYLHVPVDGTREQPGSLSQRRHQGLAVRGLVLRMQPARQVRGRVLVQVALLGQVAEHQQHPQAEFTYWLYRQVSLVQSPVVVFRQQPSMQDRQPMTVLLRQNLQVLQQGQQAEREWSRQYPGTQSRHVQGWVQCRQGARHARQVVLVLQQNYGHVKVQMYVLRVVDSRQVLFWQRMQVLEFVHCQQQLRQAPQVQLVSMGQQNPGHAPMHTPLSKQLPLRHTRHCPSLTPKQLTQLLAQSRHGSLAPSSQYPGQHRHRPDDSTRWALASQRAHEVLVMAHFQQVQWQRSHRPLSVSQQQPYRQIQQPVPSLALMYRLDSGWQVLQLVSLVHSQQLAWQAQHLGSMPSPLSQYPLRHSHRVVTLLQRLF